MRRRLVVLGLLAFALGGCGSRASVPRVATATPHPAASPATMTVPTPFAFYSQEHVGEGRYQLVNDVTEQFVEVTANGTRTLCPRSGLGKCASYVKIGVTEYSGNTQVKVSRREFALRSTVGGPYAPATARQAKPVIQPSGLLPDAVLHPDDDGDFVSGILVFVVPEGPGRFSLLWRGRHVATFKKTAQGKLQETR